MYNSNVFVHSSVFFFIDFLVYLKFLFNYEYPFLK